MPPHSDRAIYFKQLQQNQSTVILLKIKNNYDIIQLNIIAIKINK